METSFRGSANDNPALFKKVPVNVRAGDASVWGKANAHELAEPTRVVVSLRLRVAERFENGVGLKNLAL